MDVWPCGGGTLTGVLYQEIDAAPHGELLRQVEEPRREVAGHQRQPGEDQDRMALEDHGVTISTYEAAGG